MKLTNCYISLNYYPLPEVAHGFMIGDMNMEFAMAETLAQACWFEGKVQPHPIVVDMITAAVIAAREAAVPGHTSKPAPDNVPRLNYTPEIEAALIQLNKALENSLV